MKTFESLEEILDFAIEQEQLAVEFYTKLATKALSDDMRKTFEEFAREEIGHKAKLTKFKAEGISVLPKEKIADLKIADYTVTEVFTPNMTYEAALKLAMSKEKAALKLYSKLSEITFRPAMKELFAFLAQEESKHKLRFEIEYDDHFLKEN